MRKDLRGTLAVRGAQLFRGGSQGSQEGQGQHKDIPLEMATRSLTMMLAEGLQTEAERKTKQKKKDEDCNGFQAN